jgi:YesN/AraC family two-component response regulator
MMDEYALYFIKSGELYIEENGIQYTLRKNDAFLLEPNLCHTGFKKSCCDYYYIHFKHKDIVKISDGLWGDIRTELHKIRHDSKNSDCFCESYYPSTPCYLPKLYHYENSCELFEILNVAIEDFYNHYENYKAFASWKFAELLLKLSRDYISTSIFLLQSHQSKTYTNAAKLQNYLNSNYSKKISSTVIETLFESNYDYLNRIFQKLTGTTIFSYLGMVRIAKAKELILTTSLKFTDIAYLVGFDDQYYFSRFFKKSTGMTPTEYYKCNSGELSVSAGQEDHQRQSPA